jgi:hypothetical protein
MNPLLVLRDAWFFFSHNLVPILRLCLPLILLESLAVQVLGLSSEAQPAQVRGMLANLLFYPLYGAALILYLDARSRGQRPAALPLLATALRIWPSLALLVALSTLLLMLGLSLYLLPGIWLMVKIVFAEYLLVLRGLHPLAAIRASFSLSQGHFWAILACTLSVVLPMWVLDAWIQHQLGEQPELAVALFFGVLRGVCQLFVIVTLFRLYMLAVSQPVET